MKTYQPYQIGNMSKKKRVKIARMLQNRTWLEKAIHNNTHDQELAKAFYEYLLMKFK